MCYYLSDKCNFHLYIINYLLVSKYRLLIGVKVEHWATTASPAMDVDREPEGTGSMVLQ